MVLGKMDNHLQKDKFVSPYILDIKNYSKDLNWGPKITKLLAENKGGNFHELELGYRFKNMISKAQVTITKVDKLDIIKL